MSFPIGTRGEDVRDIATDVAERFFQTDQGHFDYIIAVHEDRDHPHAHLVLNRRSQEGEFFFLGRNHRFNYDDFRLAMVEEAEKYGVRLEATRRVDRGVVHYPAPTREVYAAKEEGRAPRERERVGADLTRTLAEIANTRTVYHALAAEASREAREDIAAALFRAGELLARGGQVDRTGDVYMAEDQSFEDLRSLYAEKLARVQGMTREVDRIMEARDVRTSVADAVTDDLRVRYPDMPSHLARGLGATYAAVVEIRDTEAINQVRRETEMREGLGVGTRDALLAARGEAWR